MTTLLSLDQINARLHDLSSAGVAIGYRFIDGAPHGSFFSYSQDWLTHYETEGLIQADPTIIYGFSTTGRRTWAELAADGFDNKVFDAARTFGISNGTVFALRVNGAKTIASISHDGASLDEAAIREAQQLLALGAMIVEQEHPRERYKLTADQRFLIKLILDGASDDDICGYFGFDPRTLRRRKDAVMKVTGATSLPVAIHRLHEAGIL